MSPGDFFVVFFVAIIFFGGITIGYKLYKWNMQDQKRKKERNDEIKKLYKVFLQQKLNEIFTKSLKNNNTRFNQANDAFFLRTTKEKSENRFVLRRERAIVVAMINSSAA